MSPAGKGDPGIVAEIKWVANPFRGDAFEEIWLPAAEAVLDFGATGWALFRDKDGALDFTQLAFFPTKLDFERYWYSDEIGEVRAQAAGYYQVPILPTFHTISGSGTLAPAIND
jgi:hypothetical protein